jgi:CAAX protease family protein
MGAITGLFYDSQAHRLGPFLRGHFLLYDKREAPSYSPATGIRLLAIFVVLEFVVGPRASLLSWLGFAPPDRRLRIVLLLAVSILAARLWAKASFSDIGFLRWRKWTTTERLYFAQVVLLATAIFLAVNSQRLSLFLGRFGAWTAVTVIVTELLWGFYQEVNYRGILQTELARRLGHVWGPLLANLVYTVGPLHFYHFTSTRSWASTVAILAATFGIGLVFAFIFHRTRNIWLVGLMHGIGNVFVNGSAHLASLSP